MLDLSQVIGALVLLLVGLLVGAVVAWFFLRKRKSGKPVVVAPTVSSQITELRSVGELRVFKGVSKDILTHVDHSFGDFGKKYLSWAFTKKKLAMVFEFEMDFSYDLRSHGVTLRTEKTNSGSVTIVTLPPCKVDVSIKDIRFYDEQRARFLPWLLPDLVQGFFDGRFSEDDKNALISAAKSHALAQANELFVRYKPQVETSAFITLNAMMKPMGAEQVKIQFAQEQPAVSTSVGVEALQLPSSERS
jgi:Protein of unknown function (DUF4230)